jgi:hypothetical protein
MLNNKVLRKANFIKGTVQGDGSGRNKAQSIGVIKERGAEGF